MGCDITLYIEYDKNGSNPFTESRFIQILADGEFDVWRDYKLFSALAGVRSYDDETPKHPPRGFPKTCSNKLIHQLYSYVLEEGEKAEYDDEMSKEDAEHYVNLGLSHYRDQPEKKQGLVSDPDAHTPSWLLYSEVIEALEHFGIKKEELHYNFQLILDILELLETKFGKNRSRIVFWFCC